MREVRVTSNPLSLVALFVACTPNAHVATTPQRVERIPDVHSPSLAVDADAPSDRVADVVQRWNDAHNHHDADAFAALYATTVTFYGADLTNAECVKRKRDALAAAPDYAQTLSDLEVAAADENNGVFVRLKKHTTGRGRSKSFFGYLYVIGGRIVAEGDRTPDPSEIATRYTYCYAPEPNDLRVGIFKVSALEAILTVRYSKAFAEQQAASHAPLSLSIRDCAHGCAPGDFGTCKEGDVVPFLVVAGGVRDVASFAVDPLTKKVTR